MRRYDWADRMFKVIDAHIHAPFDPVLNHCAMVPARIVDAMTGSNHVERILAECPTAEAIDAFIAGHGGLQGAVTSFLGEPTADRALRGDVVLIDGGEGESLGICDGRHIIAMGEQGLHRLLRTEAKVVWRV